MAATRRIYRVVSVAALGLAALAAVPEAKHIHLDRSEPGADLTIAAAPTTIKLWFSGPVQIPVTTVRVTGADNSVLGLSPPRLGTGEHAPVILDIRCAVAPGRYTVAWRTMSRDGHPVSGTFAFTLAAPHQPLD